jgi:maltokinase
MRPLAVEQSNTSVVFDEQWILKAFRRIHDGPNPDVEVMSALERVGFAHVPSTAAVWTHQGADLAVVRRYIGGGSDGFDLARTSLRDLFDARVAPEEAGGDFGPEAARLGQLTGRLHLALGEAFGLAAAEPARWATELVAELARVDMRGLPDGRVAEVYAELAATPAADAGAAIRVHGDLHLGQVIRGDEGWFVLDFEGEPTRPVAERRFTASPLRDVAGMLRSLAYAPEVVLIERGADAAGDPELRALAARWERRSRVAFLHAYLGTPDIERLLPTSPGMRATVLAALELGKAVYEVDYEQAHRPDWVHIPLGAVQRLSAAAVAGWSELAGDGAEEGDEP